MRPFVAGDIPWAEHLLATGLGGRMQARLGELVDALALPGLVAEADGERAGLVTYAASGDGSVEIVSIEATPRGAGVGTRLLEAVQRATGARRLWLVTTNDNLDALRFYQRRGFRLAALHPGAVDEARAARKPQIPALGGYGIPVRDEIVLERLGGA